MRTLRIANQGEVEPAAGTPVESAAARRGELFDPGRNCFSVAHADHVGLLVDGEEYFRSFMLAAEQATHSIVILSWEFNSTTRLCFDPGASGRGARPSRLGDYLNWLARRRRGLRIHILDWDYPLVFGTDRELRPFYGFGWRPHRRVRLACDNTQPVGGSHHQKIVVIDDALAFIGGFDLTVRRWDTCAHAADEKRRICDDKPYAPFHDLMMAVDGEAARQLGDLVRERWLAATGRRLRAPGTPQAHATWPGELRIDLADVDVAFARTLPELPNRPAVSEVQALYLDMIAAARERIYIENQYFTAHSIGDALAARLQEDDGPEIVVAVRLFSHGWLEEHTMHVLRTRLIERLHAADAHGRFHIYYPHVDGLADGLCIDLHSKLMIVDDEILRIGSANISNRSMGMDSECDAAIEARGDPKIAAVIHDFRTRLLAEHLDVEPAAVDAALARHGSLHGAIDALAGRCRTLRRLEKLPEWSAAVFELASVADPERPVSLDQLVDDFSPEHFMAADSEPRSGQASKSAWRARLLRLAAVVLLIAGLAAMWRFTPLAQWVDAEKVSDWARQLADRPWAPLLILLAYTPACVLMFPRPLITLAAVVAFGPLLGFVYALTGILIAALATYLAGLALPRRTVARLGGERLMHLADMLRRRSLVAMTALRLVPVAPFAVLGLVAAAIRVPLLPYLLGTLIGMLPGTMATTLFGEQFEVVLNDPSKVNYGVLALVVAGVLALSLVVRRWLVRQHRRPAATAHQAQHTTRRNAHKRPG